MLHKSSLQNFMVHSLTAVVLATTLNACQKATETETRSVNQPSVSGNTIKFSSNSTLTQRLITSPVVSAQENVLKLPGRIVWDEDHTARISTPIAGRLSSVLVQIGAEIKADQALAYLSSPDLGSAQADAEKAKSDLTQAERNWARNKELSNAGIIAGKELEQSQADLLKSKAEAMRASVRLKSLGGANSVDQRFTIKSPISGILVARNTNPGMEWRPEQESQPLFIVSDPSYLWCWIDAPEQALNAFQKNTKVILRSSAWPNETFEATVDFIADALDPVSRTLKVRAKLHNPTHKLKGEMYVTAELTSITSNTLDIPAKAVFLKDGVQMVFIKSTDGTYIRKTIKPVVSNDKWVSITEGLNQGDEVVLDGALYLEKILEKNITPAASNTPQSTPKAK